MCLQCLPVSKNKDQRLHDSTENKNKDANIEEYEQVLTKGFNKT